MKCSTTIIILVTPKPVRAAFECHFLESINLRKGPNRAGLKLEDVHVTLSWCSYNDDYADIIWFQYILKLAMTPCDFKNNIHIPIECHFLK